MAAGSQSLIELPRVNLEGILTKSPLPSLLACCCVSKSLLNLIKEDSEFARIHLAKSEPQLMIQSSCIRLIDLDTDAALRVEVKPNLNTPLDGFRIKHSCNGLVLLEHTDDFDNVIRCMIYNPVTGEYTLLPELVAPFRTVSGFFYCPETNRFEVLCSFYRVNPISDDSSHSSMELDRSSDSDSDMELYLVSDHDTNSEGSDPDTGSEDQSPYSDSDYVYSVSDLMGEIYVKGSRSWESLGILPFSPLTIYSTCHLKKAVHWMCSDKAVPNLIVLFNFETHEFGEISGPAHLAKSDALAYTDLVMVVVGNRLSIIDRFTNWLKFSVWVMKEYGVKDSWCQEFVVDTFGWLVHASYCLMPIICRNNGELVMVSDHGFMLLYDMNKKKGRVVNHPPLVLGWRALMHTPSFISLTDVVSGTTLEVVKVAPRLADPGLISNNYLELSATFSDEADCKLNHGILT